MRIEKGFTIIHNKKIMRFTGEVAVTGALCFVPDRGTFARWCSPEKAWMGRAEYLHSLLSESLSVLVPGCFLGGEDELDDLIKRVKGVLDNVD